jgi:hypothetical protein
VISGDDDDFESYTPPPSPTSGDDQALTGWTVLNPTMGESWVISEGLLTGSTQSLRIARDGDNTYGSYQTFSSAYTFIASEYVQADFYTRIDTAPTDSGYVLYQLKNSGGSSILVLCNRDKV